MRSTPSASWLLVVLTACAAGGRAAAPMAERGRAVDERPAALEGEVVGPDGKPVVGALVSVWSHFDADTADPPFDAVSDARGHFRFATLPAARWAATATSPGLAAAYGGAQTTPPGAAPVHVTLRLGGPAQTIEGTIRDETRAAVANARVIAATFSENEDEVYVTRSDARGRYVLTLPAGSGHLVVVDAPPRRRASLRVDGASASADVTLAAPPAPRPDDDALRAWLHAHATPLSPSADALDEAGARVFESIAGDASVVAIGEATHGSAEFPDWRRRVFEALARDRAFTVYAMEAPPAALLDEYVVHGKGDPVEAIHALSTWVTDTTETLALVQWMRAYDADPAHASKVHVEGFDVYTPAAVPPLLSYLESVDPPAVADARKALAPFERVGCDATYPELPSAEQERARQAVDALVKRFDDRRAAYVARSTEPQWARARQLARVVQEAEETYRDESVRDRYMAENVRWLVDHYPEGTRFVLYAHDNHIAAEGHGLSQLGALLRQSLGDRYVAIGFSFGEGSSRALDWRDGRSPNAPLRALDVGRAPPDTLDAALALAGLPAFVVDLRTAEGPVAAWLRSPLQMHSIRGWFAGEKEAFETFAPRAAFDAIVYVDRISPSHPLGPAPSSDVAR